MMYGIIVSDGSIFTVNVIGAILQSSYFLVYYKYSEDIVSISRKTSTVNILILSFLGSTTKRWRNCSCVSNICGFLFLCTKFTY